MLKPTGISFRSIVDKASVYLPQIPKPKKKLTLTQKFVWSGLALLVYLVMGQIPLYGAPTSPFDPFAAFRVIFASQRGTLIELGIGPIVTAGLLMQLLKGAEIFKLDFKNPEDRALFTSATKLVTIIVIIVEGAIYGSMVYKMPQDVTMVIIGQLIGASLIVMFLDEMVQKGWGLGSGISLFIMAGVAQSVLWHMFSPVTAQDGLPFGVFPMLIQMASSGNFDIVYALLRLGQLPNIIGLLVTIAIIALLLFTQGMKIEIPIVSSRFRGFTASYPIKFMYVSNVPVILASALIANLVFMSQLFWANYNPLNNREEFNWIAMFDPQNPTTPIGGIVKFLIPTRGIETAISEPLHAVAYVLILTGIVVLFGRLWIELGGLSPKAAASSLIDADVQVPGFRRVESSIEMLLKRYIPSVTLMSSLFLGFLAGGSDVLGAFGTGTGLLLMVDILINYYNLLLREQIDVYMPRLSALLGRK
ncbi:MAG: preprotein translocase subunit SecY [Candidatus Nitrosocaldus sp.]